jgi:hypothetical protein
VALALAGCHQDPGKGDPGGNGSNDLGAPGDGSVPSGSQLKIMPQNPVVVVTTGQAPPTVQFSATVNGASVTAGWGIDRGEIGAIDGTGVFTTSGNVGGKANITALYGTLKASTSVTVQIINVQSGDPAYQNPPAPVGAGGYGGVGGDGPGAPASSGQQGTLGGTPTADSSVTLLYPYDQTVWPRGMLAPLLQWKSGGHHFDSAYVHIQENNFEYKGYFAANMASNFVNLPLPQQAWDQLGYSNGGEDVHVSIVFAEGQQAFGPYQETWKIAPATLKGTIYYNSYGTYLVQNSATDGPDKHSGGQYGAATLAIKPGATSPTLVAGVTSIKAGGDGTGCRVCHTVSANGGTLVTQASNLDATSYADTRYINLVNDTSTPKGSGTSLQTQSLTFPALSPDGTLLFSSAGVGGMIFGGDTNPSQLYSLPSGAPVAGVTGLPGGFQAQLPVFSPDGQHIAFNFWSGAFSNGPSGDKISLAMLDFNAGSKAFSNAQKLYTPGNSKQPVTYSSFLPNSAGVIFEIELTNPTGNFGFTWNGGTVGAVGNTGELWWVDVASKQAHRLDQLNGANGPNDGPGSHHPPGLDPTLNYEPTINPIVSGGYAWVVFTSRRMYGNVANDDPWKSDPRLYDATAIITDKKLWVAAIDLNAKPGSDPSHPAFYLPAQEIHAGNSRGYWTVDPCHADGTSCNTGDECCGGYCQAANGGLVCSSTVPTCAAEFDKCNTTADCCGAIMGITCINHICTQGVPITRVPAGPHT